MLPPAKDRTTGGTTQVSNELQKRFQKRKELQGEGMEIGKGGGRLGKGKNKQGGECRELVMMSVLCGRLLCLCLCCCER